MEDACLISRKYQMQVEQKGTKVVPGDQEISSKESIAKKKANQDSESMLV